MSETYEQALTRLTGELRRTFGYDATDWQPSQEIQQALERSARWALEIAPLPVLDEDTRGNYHCPTCGRTLQRNYATTDADGYASLNCIVHGLVGKWFA